jgi:hypothetical protein
MELYDLLRSRATFLGQSLNPVVLGRTMVSIHVASAPEGVVLRTMFPFVAFPGLDLHVIMAGGR